ncbi:MAG: zinc-binding dehydrogenase [Chloroflexi bacterium]|nr:zinc-binding dehydrogenase [Chloroflexota bacterium]
MRARAAVFLGPGQPFDLREYPVPDPEPGAIIVKIRLSNICGSDLHQWRGDGGSAIPPGGRVMGHEMAGEVARLGAGVATDSLGQPLKEGDRIAYAYFYPCRRCWACTRGRFVLCAKRAAHYQESADQWPHLNGGYADYYYLRPNHFVFKVPDEVTDDMVAPANCALSQVIFSLKQAGFTFGDTLVVQGAGGLGLYAIAAARDMGAEQIIAIDALPQRLVLAKQFGADEVIGLDAFPSPEARVQQVRDLTRGRGASVVLEVVGLPHVIPEGLQMVRSGGTYLEVGLISAKFSVEMHPANLLRNNTRYVAVNHYEPYILGEALEFLRRNRTRYPFDKIVSHRFPLAQIDEAFAQAEWFGRQPGQATITRAAIAPGR